MFLPTELTSSEEDLAATLTRQLLDQRRPADAAQERAVRQEAAQVAAELIQAQRAETAPDPEDDEQPETGYHTILQNLLARRQAILDDEADQAP